MNSFLGARDNLIVVNNGKDRVTSVVTTTESFELDVNFLRAPVAADRAERPVRRGTVSTRLRRWRDARRCATGRGLHRRPMPPHSDHAHTTAFLLLLSYYVRPARAGRSTRARLTR